MTHWIRLQQWYRSRRIGIKFLLVTLPVIILSALLFLAALVYFEARELRQVNRELAEQRAQRDAYLLSNPVWNLEQQTIVAILQSLAQNPRLHCVRLDQMFERGEVYEAGDCLGIENLHRIETPVYYRTEMQDTPIGRLVVWVDISVDRGDLWEDVSQLMLLVLVLALVLAACVFVAFRRTILLPLEQVAKSMRTYQEQGRRAPVDWHQDDELGRFIHEYNAGLLRQEQAEQSLMAAMQKAEQALRDLQRAQQSLVQSEKLASLGSLVAGIAHEINTPVGSSLTVATTLAERVQEFQRDIAAGSVRRSTLSRFAADVEEACRILQHSLLAAAEQIQQFKQVAVDQTSSQRRRFDLKTTLEEVLSTLRPRIKHSNHRLLVDIPEFLEMDSYPGPLGQVVTNCFTNALLHGFEGIDAGTLRIQAEPCGAERIRLEIQDDGRGMEPRHLKRVFDPFFTTRMGRGGTGLGMNLVYTIVTGLLGGSIELDSQPGTGTRVILELPRTAPSDSDRQLDQTHARQ